MKTNMKTRLQTYMETAAPALLFVMTLVIFSTTVTSQDQAEVWIQLNVTALHEEYFLAGDPATRVNYSTDIGFTHYGFYTFSRFSTPTGYQYMALPGRGTTGRTPQVMDISVIQTHPCMDGQSLLIGRETRKIPARILPGTIGLVVKPVGSERIAIQLSPVEIDADMLECSNPDCMNGFGFSYGDNVVGLDRSTYGEDDFDYEDYEDNDDYEDIEEATGYDLIELDYNLLKKIAAGGGEIPLTIPISVDKVYEKEEDTPTGPVSTVYTFRVEGWIGAVPAGE